MERASQKAQTKKRTRKNRLLRRNGTVARSHLPATVLAEATRTGDHGLMDGVRVDVALALDAPLRRVHVLPFDPVFVQRICEHGEVAHAWRLLLFCCASYLYVRP